MSEELNNEVTADATEEVVVEETKVEEAVVAAEEPVVVEAPAPESDVISAPEPVENEKPGLGYVENGVMGSTTVPKTYTKKAAKSAQVAAQATEETVAVYSDRNVAWQEVGKLSKGFNIVTKNQAEKWVAVRGVRLATPEEVAQGYAK